MLLLLFAQIYLSSSQLIAYSVNPPHNCDHFGLCTKSSSPMTFYEYCNTGTCVCQAGYTGDRCQTEIDKCTPSPCPDKDRYSCEHTITGYACLCATGWTGDDCDIITSSPCAEAPCQNEGTCKSENNIDYTCDCKDPYFGTNCTYRDPCKPNPCQNSGTCKSIYNGQHYTCACTTLFYGRNCETYKYVYSASYAVQQGCLQFDGSVLVEPKYFKVSDGQMTYTKCQQELGKNPHDPPYNMTTLVNTDCYLSVSNGLNVTADMGNACNDSSATCPGLNSEFCGKQNTAVIWSINKPLGTATMYCDYSTMVLLDYCKVKEGGGTCVSVAPTGAFPNGIVCLCQGPKYIQSAGNTTCLLYDICTDKAPCQNGATCTSHEDQRDYTCTCDSGYTGKNCEVLEVCSASLCLYGGTCTNTGNSYKCDCLPHYTGPRCGSIDVCEYANPCVNGANCTNMGSGIQIWPYCKCKDGYAGQYCEKERDFCSEFTPCQYNSTCIKKFNGYTCNCTFGTKGDNCEQLINYCAESLDAKGNKVPSQCNKKDPTAQCISGTPDTIGTFYCNCSKNWANTLCDLNKIIEEVMIAIYGKMDETMIPLLNDLLSSPAQITDMMPFMIGTLPYENRTEMSWQFGDMFSNAAYEEKELILNRDFYQWNDVVLGNCFTFNHYNNSYKYNYRSSQTEGGLRARLKLNQGEYAKWTDTAAILVFVHFKDDYIMSESIRYNAEPGSEVVLVPYRNEFNRLRGQYGTCVKDTSEVKAFYFPGSYTTDGCLRSCYQDKIQEECECMDPRYPMPELATPCVVSNMTCIDAAVKANGDPSKWSTCVCPLPCTNNDFEITWSKGEYRKKTPNCVKTSTGTPDEGCQGNTSDTVTVLINRPQLVFNLFREAPTMDLNKLIGSLGGLLGVLMGICAMTFVEVTVMIFRAAYSMLCKPQ